MSTPECRKDCDVYADWQKMEGDTAGHLLDIARFVTQLKKALNWMTWLKKRFPCECEPNQTCVKCNVLEDIINAEQALKVGGKWIG